MYLRLSSQSAQDESVWPSQRRVEATLASIARVLPAGGPPALSSLVVLILAVGVPELSVASAPIPGEGRAGLLHILTHLHPAAYVVLFCVFVLSIVNLVFHYGISTFARPLSLLSALLGLSPRLGGTRPVLKGLRRTGFDGWKPGASGGKKSELSGAGSSIDAVTTTRAVTKLDPDAAAARIPTPLDGVNHPMPKFFAPPGPQSGAPRVLDAKPGEKALSTEFRFSSAVDVPSREEMERREKSQLVVSGSVLGPDGKGMSSVIVYLADGEGNRVGQSCRSMAETGEFKVLVNEPGTYLLKGYKRGFVMESPEPLTLPIQSGKIQGYNFQMIPEGCTVLGRVCREDSEEGIPDCEVTCVNADLEERARSTKTDSEGKFLMYGVPLNAEYVLEVRSPDGTLTIRTEPFQTLQKKEHSVEIKLPLSDRTAAHVAEETPDADESSSEPVQSPAV